MVMSRLGRMRPMRPTPRQESASSDQARQFAMQNAAQQRSMQGTPSGGGLSAAMGRGLTGGSAPSTAASMGGQGMSGASRLGAASLRGLKSGGSVKSSASKRADGCAQRGKTKGKMV